MPHGRRALRDDEHRAVQLPERLPEPRVRRIVERGGAVVEDEHFGIADEGARDGQPLPLSAREVLALLLDGRVQPALRPDDVLRLRKADGARELLVRRPAVAP